jgi:hypothetical protein
LQFIEYFSLNLICSGFRRKNPNARDDDFMDGNSSIGSPSSGTVPNPGMAPQSSAISPTLFPGLLSGTSAQHIFNEILEASQQKQSNSTVN